jgi:glycosyltransferase involved in cell wall biosynthesis
MFTIITPTIKRDPKIIQRCIDSVNGQSFEDWEHIIISDCPQEDHVIELINNNKFSEKRKYLFNDSGYDKTWGAIPRNMGIYNADPKSKFIIFLDDDNIIFPHHLRTMWDLIGDKKAGICPIFHNGPLNPQFIPEYMFMVNNKKFSYILTGETQKLYLIDSLNIVIRTDIMQKCGWVVNTEYVNDGQTIEKLFSEYVKDDYVITNEVLGLHY